MTQQEVTAILNKAIARNGYNGQIDLRYEPTSGCPISIVFPNCPATMLVLEQGSYTPDTFRKLITDFINQNVKRQSMAQKGIIADGRFLP